MESLKSYVDREVESSGAPVREAKDDAAFELGISLSTLYLWIKSGNYYIESVGAGLAGDDSYLIIWKQEKILT